MKKNGYIGQIGHGATQDIKAPAGKKSTVKGNVMRSGNDLRTGRSKKSSK